MAKHYLIGIGGTGARVVEAVLHCCAAGFAPEGLTDLTVFLVDPDEGNGNLSRTKTLVAQYQRARDAVAERDTADVRIFATPVAAPDPFVWGIFSDQNMSLGRYINHELARKSSPPVAEFMEVLFSGEELGTRLNEGFRGHPSIGAVVMANTPDDVEPWQSFWADVEASQSEGAVRVFLVGSIFGGTGAAGVPTFGAPGMLKWDRRATLTPPGAAGPGQSKVFLGAALVLPYFTVEDLPAERHELFVTPADFPVATKAALRYYDEKDASGKLAFDQVYLLGDSLPQPVGKFSPGNRDQQNRPHYVEVAGALAALDFFRQDPAADAVRGGPRFFAASRSGREVDWRALPVTRDAGRLEALQAEFERRVAAMTVFAYAFNTLGTELLSDAYAEPLPAWYKEHFKANARREDERIRDPRQQRPALEHVAEFNRSFLAWVAALDDGDDEEGRVRLVDRTRLFAGAGASELVSPRTNKAAVGGVLKGVTGQGLTFDRVRAALDGLHLRPAMPAASLYVNLFYEAALRFVDENYRLGATRP